MKVCLKIILKNLIEMWSMIGARVETMDPKHHDLVLAVTSHSPHLIAYTMVGVADDLRRVTNSEVVNYSAAGFRDFTRIAASDPTMWRDVFFHNKEFENFLYHVLISQFFDVPKINKFQNLTYFPLIIIWLFCLKSILEISFLKFSSMNLTDNSKVFFKGAKKNNFLSFPIIN